MAWFHHRPCQMYPGGNILSLIVESTGIGRRGYQMVVAGTITISLTTIPVYDYQSTSFYMDSYQRKE